MGMWGFHWLVICALDFGDRKATSHLARDESMSNSKNYEIPTGGRVVKLNTMRLAGQRCLQLRHEWSHADDGDFVKRTVTRSTQSSP